MPAQLTVHRFGPTSPIRLLALHGLTGHGARWGHLARQLPEISIAAPDLLGHGHSSWAAPWSMEANVAALAAVIDEQADAPVLVVGHSFGGALALRLAAAHPEKVAGLLLLDPAAGLDGDWACRIAEAMFAAPDYTSPAEARAEKAHGSWADVDPAVLDADLAAHLIRRPTGRFGWRVCMPAMMAYWSELARPVVLPHAGTPTVLIRATRTTPAYVTETLITDLWSRLGSDFEHLDFDCDHMVAEVKPAEVAAVIRAQLAG